MIDITDPEWLTKALDDKGLSVAELARRSGVNKATIHRMIAGSGGTLETLRPIIRALSEVSK